MDEHKTGLRGDLATMERKIHDFRLNFGQIWRSRVTVARAPRGPVAFAAPDTAPFAFGGGLESAFP